jgi:hypothetical protein
MTDWLERLCPGELPIFRRTREVLLAFGPQRDRLTARQVALEILADPFATLHTIHTVNRKVGERYGTEVTTVEHALMMQGIGAYLDASQELPVLEDTPAGRDPRTLKALQILARRAQHAAWQARDFAVLHSDVRAEEVQVAAILHHLPEMLLRLRAPEEAWRLQRLRRATSAVDAEIAVLGSPLKTLRGQLLEAWSIPDLTRDLLSDANAGRVRQALLSACLDIAAISDKGWWEEGLMVAYETLAGMENTPLETVIATVHGNAARVARSCEWLPTSPAAAWGPMIPGPWPPDEDDEEPAGEATTQPAVSQAIQAGATAAAEAPKVEQVAPPTPDKRVFSEALKNIEGHLDGSLTLNQMSALILKGLHTGLGLSRIVFARITPDGQRVKSRFSLGIPPEDPMRHFEFQLNGKDLFAQLMTKMQGVWINEGNRARLWPLVDAKLQKLIGSGDFYAMSLYSGSRPLGLIYADRGHGAYGLDPLTYTDFKMLCLQAARGLGKVRE